MNKQKEILELRKLYLTQFEKFETKSFFTFLTFSLSLILISLDGKISYWWGIGLFLFTTIVLELILECWRKKAFNKIIRDIKEGNLGEI